MKKPSLVIGPATFTIRAPSGALLACTNQDKYLDLHSGRSARQPKQLADPIAARLRGLNERELKRAVAGDAARVLSAAESMARRFNIAAGRQLVEVRGDSIVMLRPSRTGDSELDAIRIAANLAIGIAEDIVGLREARNERLVAAKSAQGARARGALKQAQTLNEVLCAMIRLQSATPKAAPTPPITRSAAAQQDGMNDPFELDSNLIDENAPMFIKRALANLKTRACSECQAPFTSAIAARLKCNSCGGR